jgi:hypothetical protein
MQHTQRMHTHLQHLPHANSNISHTCRQNKLNACGHKTALCMRA